MSPALVIEPTRIQRTGWKALKVALFLAQIGGVWAYLGLKPGPLTDAVKWSTEIQVSGWLILIVAALFGLWKLSDLLVNNAAAVIHSGRNLRYDMPLMVTGVLGLSLALAAIAPFTSGMAFMLAGAVLSSLVGNWLHEVSTVLDAEEHSE